MNNITIRVDNLSKQYFIGGKQAGYDSLRDSLSNALMSPFRRALNLLSGQATGAAELDEEFWEGDSTRDGVAGSRFRQYRVTY